MKIEIVATDRIAERGAGKIAAVLRAAVAARGRATVAFSGGSSAVPLLHALAGADVPWASLHVLEVDQRRRRRATGAEPDRPPALPLDRVPPPADQLHAMPVDAEDPDAAAARFAATLQKVAGRPPRLDLVHLGLGPDGHTASLVPGSPLLSAREPVGMSAAYQGWRRMTLTLPVLSRARHVLWFVFGAGKAAVVRRLVDGEAILPAGKVERSHALLLLDAPGASALPSGTAGDVP